LKKVSATVAVLFIALSVYGQSGDVVSLDEAIENSALRIREKLDNGAKIVVYRFQSHNDGLSKYVFHELFDRLVNTDKFTVLDRTAQEVINAEIGFQFVESAGMISDESLASLTRRIGAEAIVTGSLDEAGNEYRFRIKVIGTETTAAVTSYAAGVSKNDTRITGFVPPKPPPGAGQKTGTGALNVLFGLGSYLERDIAGGVTLTAGYALAIGLIVTDAAALDWDSPGVGVPSTIGVVTAGLTFAYGFARPFIFNRSPKAAAVLDNTRSGVTYTGNRAGFQITYTIRF
jgi:hypothetical protein